MILVGPSGSGKTFWVKKLLSSNLIDPPAERIIYLYAEFQPLYKEMKGVEFIEGVPLDLYERLDSAKRTVLIVDDLMHTKNAQDLLVRVFTVLSHHKNLTCINLQQVLFPKQAQFRTNH